MSIDLDERIRRAFDGIINATPDLGPPPQPMFKADPPGRTARRSLTVAASITALAGVGGLALLARSDNAADPATSTPTSTQTVETVVVVPGPEPLGYVPTADELEVAVQTYADCLGERLTGTIRYNPHRYTGMFQDIGDPSASGPSDLIQNEEARCGDKTKVQSFLEAFANANPLDAAQTETIFQEFHNCVTARVPDIAAALDTARIEDLDDLEAGYLELIRSYPRETGTVISDCYEEALYGPDIRIDF